MTTCLVVVNQEDKGREKNIVGSIDVADLRHVIGRVSIPGHEDEGADDLVSRLTDNGPIASREQRL